MNKYKCSKCGEEVVIRSVEKTITTKHCDGDKDVTFTRGGTEAPKPEAGKVPSLPPPANTPDPTLGQTKLDQSSGAKANVGTKEVAPVKK